MAKQEILTVPVNLKLKDTTIATLTKDNKAVSPSETVGAWASKALNTLAEGGVILDANDVQEISTNSGKTVENNKDIVAATEPRAKKREGQVVISFTLDPANVSIMQESAEMGGRTLDEHMQEIVAMAVDQGWTGEVPAIGTRRIFTPEQEAWFAKRLGEGFTVADVQKAMRAKAKDTELELVEA